MRHYFLLFILTAILSLNSGYAQFKLLGTARNMGNGCIMLTPDKPYSEGIAYKREKLDLDQHFEIEFDIFLGKKDTMGADGIAFVIHNDPRGYNAYGTFGEGIGYGRFNAESLSGNYIAPSIAVEFDTYQNKAQNDPYSDHAAFLTNGKSYHEDYWNGGNDQLNLEDGELHNFVFKWNPETHKITTKLDNTIVFQGKVDLKKEIFNGETKVIWGFTSSTGQKYNLQYFCLRRMAFITTE